ncbi:hypothetical protein V3C33_15710 [Micrococcaceae bacterium Sec5.7]
MFTPKGSFPGFSVDDLGVAKTFYGETLGLAVSDSEMGTLELTLPEGTKVIVYPKGIMRGNGPDIAWFKDPAGNVLSVLKA